MREAYFTKHQRRGEIGMLRGLADLFLSPLVNYLEPEKIKPRERIGRRKGDEHPQPS